MSSSAPDASEPPCSGRRARRRRGLAAAFAVLAACSAPVAEPSDASPDGARDAGPIACATDRDCADGVFCNGTERCMPESPRAAAAVLPVPDEALAVAVWVGEAGESPADLDQVHTVEAGKVRGREATLLRAGEPVGRVLDLPWQEEDPQHWERAARADGRILLAGGLDADNVGAAIEAVRPWGVDASSSLETAPGVKDHARVKAYVEAANA